MRVVVAGCWRSGTTAVFNLVRLILESSGNTYAVFSDQYDEAVSRRHEHTVIKAHKYDKALRHAARIVITTHRDSEEIRASMRRFKQAGGTGNAADETNIVRGLEHWGLWMANTHYIVPFNRIRRSPEKLVFEISKLIDVKANPKQIARKLKRLAPPPRGVDPITLLHANHITHE